MMELLTALSFVAMILAPCLVAMKTGVADGADLGSRGRTEADV